MAPTQKGYDLNNRGFGIDVKYNKDAAKMTQGWGHVQEVGRGYQRV